jgi:hypothetical protein
MLVDLDRKTGYVTGSQTSSHLHAILSGTCVEFESLCVVTAKILFFLRCAALYAPGCLPVT